MPSAATIATAPTPTGSTTSALSRPPGFTAAAGFVFVFVFAGGVAPFTAVRECAFVSERSPSVLRRVISALGGGISRAYRHQLARAVGTRSELQRDHVVRRRPR